MPLVKPNKNEDKETFIDRCMSADIMNEEYPDKKQRYAVCNTQWKKRNKTMNNNYKMTEVVKGIHPETGEEIEYIRKFYSIDKAKDTGDRTLEFVMSDEQMDRDEEVILLSAWKLSKYATPVVLYNHRRHDDSKAIGKIVKVWKDSKNRQIRVKIQFPEPEVYSEADTIYKLYKNGFQFGISPSFIPNREKMIFGQKPGEPRITYKEISDWFELSLVTVPCNPRAVVQLKSIDNIKKAIEGGVVDELEINELEMFINKNIEEKNKNINNSNDDFDTEIIDEDSEIEKISDRFLIVDNEGNEIKFLKKEEIEMTENIQVNIDEAIEKALTRIKEKEKAEAEVKAKEDAIKKELEDKDKKIKELEEAQEAVLKSPAFDMEKFKMFSKEKGSNVEVGEPDEFMGFKMKAQGTIYKTGLNLSEKQESEAKRYVISKFAELSRNPVIRKSALINTTSYSAVVPAEWHDQIILKAQEGSYFGKCRPFSLDPQKTLHIPGEGAGMTLAYAGEGATLTSDSPSATDNTVQAKKYGFQGDLTYDVLQSANSDIYGYINYMAIKAHREGLDSLIFNGDAYAFTGIRGNATTSVIFGVNNGATSYTSMIADNWRDLIFSLTVGQRVGAELYMGKAVRAKLQSLPVVSGGGYPFVDPTNRDFVEGYKINESEQITDTDASSTVFGVFGNLFFYALAMEAAEGLVVNPYGGATEFNQDKILWKYRIWAAGKMIHSDHFADIGTL